MYLFLLFGATNEESVITFDEGLKMIRKSLLFESCRKNIIFSYLLIILELVLVSVLVTTFYVTSIKMIYFHNMIGVCVSLSFLYLVLSVIVYSFFDNEGYTNRIIPEVLDAETIERFENALASEVNDNLQQFSVSTKYLTSTSVN